MKIEFTQEEKAIGTAVTQIVENAPTAVAKTGVSVAGTALGIGWGLGKALFGAAKVLGSAAMDGVTAAQLKMAEVQAEAVRKQIEAQKEKTIEVEAKVG